MDFSLQFSQQKFYPTLSATSSEKLASSHLTRASFEKDMSTPIITHANPVRHTASKDNKGLARKPYDEDRASCALQAESVRNNSVQISISIVSMSCLKVFRNRRLEMQSCKPRFRRIKQCLRSTLSSINLYSAQLSPPPRIRSSRICIPYLRPALQPKPIDHPVSARVALFSFHTALMIFRSTCSILVTPEKELPHFPIGRDGKLIQAMFWISVGVGEVG